MYVLSLNSLLFTHYTLLIVASLFDSDLILKQTGAFRFLFCSLTRQPEQNTRTTGLQAHSVMTYHDLGVHALDGARAVFLFDYVYYLTQP